MSLSYKAVIMGCLTGIVGLIVSILPFGPDLEKNVGLGLLVLEKYGDKICHREAISGVFSAALGNQGFIFRSPDFDEVVQIAKFIQE